MQQATSIQLSRQHLSLLTKGRVRDGLHCLVVIYGQREISNLAQLLDLQSRADSEYHLYRQLHH